MGEIMDKSLKSYAAAAALALSLTTPASADTFLELTNIKGDSLDASFKDQIVVLAWSWGLSNSGTTHIGSGSGAGKANFNDISITKYLDNASGTLYTNIAKGDRIAKGTLSVTTNGAAGGQVLIAKYDLEDILVSSASTGGSSAEDRLTENVTLNFSKFTITTWSLDPQTGNPVQDGDPFCWDIAENKEC